MSTLDLQRFQALAASGRERFAAAAPFPHLVVDDFLSPAVAEAMVEEFEVLPDRWTHYHHVNEEKQGFNDLARMGPVSRAVIADLNAAEFLRALEVLTGISGLIADPALDGGGLQETKPGGFLNVHTDFLSHTKHRHWSRQLNLLLFFNQDWEESYRGWLELWDAEVKTAVQRIAPVFNRCVIFRTSEVSFHGVPAGVACPAGRSRKSLAIYYFRDEGRPCDLRPTRYVPLPGDSRLKRTLIHLDRWALHAYSAVKRYSPLSDAVVSRILKRL
jgi:Rps23 Pro-64 3,4-dihydroxylase Tpa1-like proline 4-hydroxylase